MINNKIIVFSVVLMIQVWSSIFFTEHAMAASKRVYSDEDLQEEDSPPPPPRHRTRWSEQGAYIFLGADLGVATYSPYDKTNEGSRSGIDLGARGLFGLYLGKSWILDSGFGFEYLSNSGTNVGGDTTSITTKDFYFDLSPRFRFNRNWNLGPEFEYWFGTDIGQNAFNETTKQPTTDANTSMFIGAQGMYEWMSDENKYRIGARYLTGLSAPQRTVNVIQVFFQYGFPVSGSHESDDSQDEESRSVSHRYTEQVNENDLKKAEEYSPPAEPLPAQPEEPTASPTPWPEQTPSTTAVPAVNDVAVIPTPPPKPAQKLVITLDVNDLSFEFNSTRLPKYHLERLEDIGKFLSQNKTAWKELVVSGHTDERGSNSYDDKLSLARARVVKRLLIQGGADPSKVKAVGYGKRKPIDRRHNEKAWARNRRVELEFRGVKDVMLMKQGVEKK